MNDNQKTYETGKPCPYCGGEMLDGGYIGRYCSNGPKCSKPDFYQEPDHFTDVSKKVKIVTEIDLSETIGDGFNAPTPKYRLDGDTVYQQEIMRPWEAQGWPIGKLEASSQCAELEKEVENLKKSMSGQTKAYNKLREENAAMALKLYRAQKASEPDVNMEGLKETASQRNLAETFKQRVIDVLQSKVPSSYKTQAEFNYGLKYVIRCLKAVEEMEVEG